MNLKALLKRGADGLARAAVTPEYLAYALASRVGDRTIAFHHASQTLALVPGYAGIYARRAFYKMTLEACGDDGQTSFGTLLSHPDTRLGSRVYIGPHGNLGLCDLGDDVLFGSDVHVLSGTRQHNFDDPDVPINAQGGSLQRVVVGRNTWVGNGARILADVGEGCVIGAGAVVTKPIPDWSVAVGHPARVVSSRK